MPVAAGASLKEIAEAAADEADPRDEDDDRNLRGLGDVGIGVRHVERDVTHDEVGHAGALGAVDERVEIGQDIYTPSAGADRTRARRWRSG